MITRSRAHSRGGGSREHAITLAFLRARRITGSFQAPRPRQNRLPQRGRPTQKRALGLALPTPVAIVRSQVGVLFSGPYNRPDGLQRYLAEQGLHAVMLDNNEGQGGNAEHDLTNDEFYSKLLKQVQMGDFVAIMAAPPCSTFSVARFFPLPNQEQPGPPPVRTRQHPYYTLTSVK